MNTATINTATINTSKLLPIHKQRIQDWIEALKSDRFNKGKNTMRDINNCYCVMGVACEISGTGTWQENDSIIDSVNKRHPYKYVSNIDKSDFQYGALPRCVLEHYGLHLADCSPYVMESCVLVKENKYRGLTNISNLNDIEDYSFSAIADTIRDTYLNK